jgi:uncharacterized membrane protein HdeD (DUF308 family)
MSRNESVDRASAYLVKSFGLSEAEARFRAEELLAALAGKAEAATHRWWAFLMRGILAIGIGLLFLLRPRPALMLLVLAFGVWVFIDGMLSIGAAIEGRGSWRLWLSGIAGIGVGLLTLMRPGITATFLYIAVGVWAIVRGVSELSAATRPRGGVEGEGWLVLSGLLSIGLGLLVIFMPHIGAPVLAWLIGLYGLADGLVMVGLSLRIRHVGELVEGVRTHVRGPEPGLT